MKLTLGVLVSLSIAAAASAQTATGASQEPASQEQRRTGDWRVTFGGEFRPFFEFYDNYNWGAGPEDDNGYYLQRLTFHTDLQMGARTRAFVEVKSGVEARRAGGSRVPDEDRLDVNQAFFDVRFGATARRHVTLRVGRHELNYGDGSLVSYREGPNMRRGYDGPKVMVRLAPWQVDAFVTRPVETDPGVFDDGWENAQRFWGVYAVADESMLGILGRPEVYYFGLTREAVRYDQGTDRETRHTVGARALNQIGGLEYYVEGTVQFGSFGDGRLRAWKHVQVYEYQFDGARLRPRLGMNLAISSGDKDPRDPDLQTFHPLFPRGLYYGYPDTSGSLNAIVAHPLAVLQLSKSVSLRNEVFAFWRQRTSDGIYSQPGFFLRTGQQSDARFIGTLGQLELVWQLDPRATATIQGGRYWVGEYFDDTPPAKDMTYFSAKVSYRF